MITIKLNPNERDWLRQLAQDNLPYAYGYDADRIAGIVTVLNPYSPWLRGYTLSAAQWHELLEFIGDEDVTTFTAGITDAINAALHCTQYSYS